MAPRGFQSLVFFTPVLLIIISVTCASSSHLRPFHHRGHSLTRRSHPSDSMQFPLPEPNEKRHHTPMHVQGHPFNPHNTPTRHRGIIFHSPFDLEGRGQKEEEVKEALKEQGLTRVIYDEEEFLTEDDYYDFPGEPQGERSFTERPEQVKEDQVVEEKNIKKMPSEKTDNDEFPKKFHSKHQKGKLKPHKIHEEKKQVEEQKEETDKNKETEEEEEEEDNLYYPYRTIPVTISFLDTEEEGGVTESSKTLVYGPDKRIPTEDGSPIVLPVTTEGKATPKQKTEDPLKVYGFPKELLPIMPGGGSRFEDVEREKLEKKKMSQTKGGDDDSAENGGSHEAEGLYSSASLSSISLCFYWLVSFHHLDRILLL